MGVRFLRRHNKSFFWAFRLLPKEARKDVIAIYSFCRQADIEVLQEGKIERVQGLLKDLQAEKANSEIPYDILTKYAIDKKVLIFFLETLLSDVPPVKYHNISDLTKYCYGSAGTIGLMICHILGQKDPEVLYNAINLGIAIRLVKIARDVEDDIENERYYIPEQYNQKNIVILADYYFQSGVKAIPFLPKQLRPAVYSAAFIYRRIGKKIVQSQKKSGFVKAKITFVEKMILSMNALIKTLSNSKKITHEHFLHEPLKGMPFVHELDK
jgi:phytoene synthase